MGITWTLVILGSIGFAAYIVRGFARLYQQKLMLVVTGSIPYGLGAYIGVRSPLLSMEMFGTMEWEWIAVTVVITILTVIATCLLGERVAEWLIN